MRLSADPAGASGPQQALRQRRDFTDDCGQFPGRRRRSDAGPAGDFEPGETEQQRGPRQVGPVADQHHPAQALRPQQPGALAGVLPGVARQRFQQQRRLRHRSRHRQAPHDHSLRLGAVPAARQQQERRRRRVVEADAALDPAGEPRKAAAAEDDDRIRLEIRRSSPDDPRRAGQEPATIASAPAMRAASAAARKRSRSPSSTAAGFGVSTPVRRSLTIW
jgi:hypothetical protein